jgi:quercetin dioxygenase-like cupin family protein
MKNAIILRATEATHVPMESGALTWLASRQLGNSETMTVGRSTLPPGGMNPRHFHPNCEEVLHVLAGRILHTMGDEEAELSPGDTITIPANVVHNARNIGDTEALLLICFSSADRETMWV